MGIKDLNKTIKSKAPDAIINVTLESLSGHGIAIDGSNLACIMMATAKKIVVNQTDVSTDEPDREQIIEIWIGFITNFLNRLLKNGIRPIFVYDGYNIPAEKAIARQGRTAQKEKTLSDIDDLKYQIEKLPLLQRNPNSAEAIALKQKLASTFTISSAETRKLKDIISSSGIPVVDAHGEGEIACVSLVKAGVASFVYSTDTDCLTHGCQYQITEITSGRGANGDTAKMTILDRVLKGFDMSMDMFIDYCITLGCDYNTRIKGIGPVKAFKLIKENGSIDSFPAVIGIKKKVDLDVSCLDHHRCRELFRIHDLDEAVQSPKMNFDIEYDLTTNLAREKLAQHRIHNWVDELYGYYERMENQPRLTVDDYVVDEAVSTDDVVNNFIAMQLAKYNTSPDNKDDGKIILNILDESEVIETSDEPEMSKTSSSNKIILNIVG